MRLVLRWLPVVFIGVAVPCAASGQTKAAVVDGQGKEAEAAKHYDAGAAAQKAGDWKAACEEYAKAYALFQHSQILISLGVAEYRAGKYRGAVEHLSGFLGAPPAGLPQQKRAEYEKYLADAKGHLGGLTVFAEVGAVVTVNGEAAGVVPATGTLDVLADPGKLVVAGVLGRRAGAQEMEVEAGGSREVRLTLVEPPSPPVTGVGRREETARGQDGRIAGKPQPSVALRTGVLVGGATLAVAGAVAGGVSLHVANQNAAVATDKRESEQGPHARREADFKNVAFWSLLGGGAAGGGALLYYLLSEPKTPPPMRVGGAAGPGGGVVVVSGDF